MTTTHHEETNMQRIALLTLALTAAAALAGPYYDAKTGTTYPSKSRIPEGRGQVSGLRNMPDAELAPLGILQMADDPTPDGMVRVGWEPEPRIADGVAYRVPVTITQAEYDAQQAAQHAAAEAADAERRVTIEIIDHPIEPTSIIIPSNSRGIGYEYFPADDGTLLNVVRHASPAISDAEAQVLKDAKKAAHYAAKVEAKAKSDDVKDKGAKIKNVAHLIPIIEAMQAQIDALQAQIGGGQ